MKRTTIKLAGTPLLLTALAALATITATLITTALPAATPAAAAALSEAGHTINAEVPIFPPDPVNNLQADQVSADAFLITWENPSYIYESSSIDSYSLEMSSESSNHYSDSFQADNRWYISGMTMLAGETFTIRIHAHNEGGSSVAETTYYHEPSNVPSIPLNPKVNAIGNETARMTWDQPAHDGWYTISRYDIKASPPEEIDLTSSTLYRTATIKGIVIGTEYTFEISAVNAIGHSETAIVSYYHSGRPTKSRNLEVNQTSADRAKLTWNQPLYDGGTDITNYEVTIAPGRGIGLEVNEREQWAIARGLSANTEYEFKVRAISSRGKGALATVTFTPLGVPTPPQNMSVTQNTTTTATLTWDQPATNRGSNIIDYVATIAPGNGVGLQTDAQHHQAFATRLSPGTEYTFLVRAISAIDAGELAIIKFTPDDTPTQPILLSIEQTATDKAMVSWAPPAHDGGATITGYEATIATGVGVGTEVNLPADARSTEASSLSPDVEYTFRIRAINTWGNGEVATASFTITTGFQMDQ